MTDFNSVRIDTQLPSLLPDMAEVVRLFYGDIPISPTDGEHVIRHTHSETADGMWIETASVDGQTPFTRQCAAVDNALEGKRAVKRAAKSALFLALRSLTGVCPPWGSLTGIRPTRLMYEGIERGLSPEEAARMLTDEFFVSADKASLLADIIDMQKGIYSVPENQFDLYIGIPFCTSRCAYCSFSSGEIGNGKLTEPYTRALISEIERSGRLMTEAGLSVRAAYMGGGTPTSIACGQLSRILDAAMEAFPGAREWTVEAGRPDTIDREKLEMLKSKNISRISVNPQTFSDETLARIGRRHTSEDTLRAYALARETGFDDINMDLIAALPGETEADFERTLQKVIALQPESVTVHSLAIKRSSKLHEQLTVAGDAHNQAGAEGAERMIAYARNALTGGGWRPYYLYRQKYMAGNLENVGYAAIGHACLYNIGNMEETAKVLALGAGAITKWLYPREKRIERCANVKNIEGYIERVDEMVARKRALLSGESI